MTETISIDGSVGEGGGQILRTALSLSMVTGRPFRIENIRANRPKPGLLRQHLTAVKASAEVCGGEAPGAAIGATELGFTPGPVRPGDYEFAIGSAGSTTLVLQTLLPALITASGPSTVTLSGGTHNIHAPTVHYLERTFLPILERMGPRVTVELERHGFYPAGGGRLRVEVTPCESLAPVELMQRRETSHRHALAVVAGLPGEIAKRELATVAKQLGWDEGCLKIEQLKDGSGPGNVLSLEIGDGEVTEVFTGFGQKMVSAQQVAGRACNELKDYLKHGLPVGPHLADQLMIPLALAGGGRFRTGPLTEHARTNASVISMFLPGSIRAEVEGRATTVSAFRR